MTHMLKNIASLCILAVLPSAALADANVRGTGTALSADCNGGVANITSTGSQVTVTGNCRAVTVVGDGNMVNIVLANNATISVRGTGNLITWSGAQRIAPRPSVRGIGNVIARAQN